VREKGRGVVAVDALVRVATSAAKDVPR